MGSRWPLSPTVYRSSYLGEARAGYLLGIAIIQSLRGAPEVVAAHRLAPNHVSS